MGTQIIYLCIGILVVLCTVGTIIDCKKNKAYFKTREEIEEERLNAEPEILTLHAEVVDMLCGVNTVGFKEPKAIKHFIIKFKNDSGEILSVSVPEESYDGFEIGLCGELTLIDGQISSFVPDDYTDDIS